MGLYNLNKINDNIQHEIFPGCHINYAVDASAGSLEIELPDPGGSPQEITYKKVDYTTNAIILKGPIEYLTSFSLTYPMTSVTIFNSTTVEGLPQWFLK